MFCPMGQPFLAAISCHAKKKAWKFNHALFQKEEPWQAETLSNVKFL